MKIKLALRSGRELATIDVQGSRVDDLKAAIHEASKKKQGSLRTEYYPSRQRLTLPVAAGAKPVVLEDGKKLSDFADLKDGATVIFKDLGPQIGYSTVFFWEYFGPLVVYPIFYLFHAEIYGTEHKPTLAQNLAVAYHSFHYAKRIFETFYVHEFSKGTMPIRNLFKNCSYYWGAAASISYFLNHPLYTSPPEQRVVAGFAAAMLCQALNLYSHVLLSKLRADGSKGYKIPRGFGFNQVTCANYMWEILGWFCFNVATQTLTGGIFMCVGALQMAVWAKAKHARLRKVFDGKDGREKYPRRWILMPPFF